MILLLSAVSKKDGFYVQLWRKNYIYTEIALIRITIIAENEISLHPNQKK